MFLQNIKRIRIERLFIGLLLILVINGMPILSYRLNAETIKLRRLVLPVSELRISPSVELKWASLENHFVSGVRAVYQFYETPARSSKPVFWLFENKEEMSVVLKSRYFALSDEDIRKALDVGQYRDRDNVLLLYSSDLSDRDFLKVLFTEYAVSLMTSEKTEEKEIFVGWLQAGLSSYSAWLADGELNQREKTVSEDAVFSYYSRFFVLDHVRPIVRLKARRDWQNALMDDPASVYAQAVLASLHLSRKYGNRSGVQILRLYREERNFEAAFYRVTGVSVAEFDEELNRNVLSKISAVQGTDDKK